MSASTLTYTKVFSSVFGDKKVAVYRITFSAGYVTDGFALSAASMGFTFINAVIPVAAGAATTDLNLLPQYDYANGKLSLNEGAADGAPFAQVTSDQTISDIEVQVLVIGN